MVYVQTGLLDRSLTDDEEVTFEQYARDNDPPDLGKWELYHPVCRRVWIARGIHP